MIWNFWIHIKFKLFHLTVWDSLFRTDSFPVSTQGTRRRRAQTDSACCQASVLLPHHTPNLKLTPYFPMTHVRKYETKEHRTEEPQRHGKCCVLQHFSHTASALLFPYKWTHLLGHKKRNSFKGWFLCLPQQTVMPDAYSNFSFLIHQCYL